MFFTISQYTLISFILIISVHYIYLYLKDNLTIPKTKDLVEKPKKQYDEIYNTISSEENLPYYDEDDNGFITVVDIITKVQKLKGELLQVYQLRVVRK